MSLWERLTSEFVDIIDWLDDSSDTMVYRYDRHGNEIKYGAKLIVREGQTAVFINEGQLADVFDPGTYTLETKNLPILSTLQSWKYGFESPFKAEVYFVNTRRFTDLKWGTKNPIMLRDKEFGPVRLRAYGTYSIRVEDSATLIQEIVGTDSHFTTDEITNQLRNEILTRFTSILGKSGIPILDLAASYDDLGEFIAGKIRPEFEEYGLELTKILVENISLPPAVEESLDKRTSMGIVGDLKAYTQFQAAESLKAAAENPSGMASGGIGMGMGFAMAKQLGESMSAPNQPPPSANMPPPLPQTAQFYVAIDDKQAGPFSMDEIKQKINKRVITRETLVWKQGMKNWTKADMSLELSSFFASVPPPLP